MFSLIENQFPWFGYMTDLGGQTLLIIVLLAALMWAFILERAIYLWLVFPSQKRRAGDLWLNRAERRSWHAQQYRNRLVFIVNRNLQRNMSLAKMLIKLCPLLGLLGTVLGMLEVFDALAATGSSNPRTTASGVSKAIITTMAGMVVAISGLPTLGYLSKRASVAGASLANQLPIDGDNHLGANKALGK